MYITFHSRISIYKTLQLLFNRVRCQQNLDNDAFFVVIVFLQSSSENAEYILEILEFQNFSGRADPRTSLALSRRSFAPTSQVKTWHCLCRMSFIQSNI